MKPELIEKVRAALDGWLEGDVTPLADLLDPDVELLWWRSGDWDIHGKKDVLALVKQRAAQRPPGVTIDVSEAGDDALIVTRVAAAGEGPLPTTLIRFRDALIVKMQQFRSAEEASRAVLWRAQP